MTKVKLAVIRSDTNKGCPFGLPIAQACKFAGDSIHRMAPTSSTDDKEKQEALKKANALVYIHHKTGNKCPFADKVLGDYNKVDCDFGDTGQGQPHVPYRGSPLYPQTLGLGGIYSIPLGLYDDGNQMRNTPFGLFSLLGYDSGKKLIKLADTFDDEGENEKANIIDGILESITCITNKEELNDKIEDVEEFIREHKEKYDKGDINTGTLFELSKKWFN